MLISHLKSPQFGRKYVSFFNSSFQMLGKIIAIESSVVTTTCEDPLPCACLNPQVCTSVSCHSDTPIKKVTLVSLFVLDFYCCVCFDSCLKKSISERTLDFAQSIIVLQFT